MMKIQGLKGMDIQAGTAGTLQAADSVSKNIQRQIANAAKQLQELSSNEEMTIEDKMKKRQEIQKQIADLNNQLRQHQIEQRKENQKKAESMEDMLGGSQKTAKSGKQGGGLSQESMQAMISADTSMKQAKVQGNMASQMEGKAGVLEAEIKMDKSRGANTGKKEEELADLQAKAQSAEEAQVSSLAAAAKAMKEAAKTEQTTKGEDGEKESSVKTEQTAGNNEGAEEVVESTTEQQARYTPVDVRL